MLRPGVPHRGRCTGKGLALAGGSQVSAAPRAVEPPGGQKKLLRLGAGGEGGGDAVTRSQTAWNRFLAWGVCRGAESGPVRSRPPFDHPFLLGCVSAVGKFSQESEGGILNRVGRGSEREMGSWKEDRVLGLGSRRRTVPDSRDSIWGCWWQSWGGSGDDSGGPPFPRGHRGLQVPWLGIGAHRCPGFSWV